ncbi:NlpC/P60 family protein [Tindallia californiensis]|uniref:S-layer homology domain-containing protein n=1 Tax=Tindallia californiensis TaxID=159292 RepID=A0A1H3J3J1_9FIRM|nr:NlpC/P60 family protein [Tindallia californiensis]SDY34155.1 S-layer homology domain-containing protein [Tindallia californiensis]
MKYRMILVLVILVIGISIPSAFATFNGSEFSDVDLTDWHVGYVLTLSDMDVVRGYSDSTFRPDATISKAEFIVLAMKTSHRHYQTAENEHWAMNYIRAAEEMGAIEPGDAETMALDEPINRAEAARILVRTQLTEDTEGCESYIERVKDYEKIPEAYQTYVLKAFAKNWISGYPDGSFQPDNKVTRAEASVMLTKSMGQEAQLRMKQMLDEAEKLLQREIEQAEDLRESILDKAMDMKGVPYRFGGSSPNTGFDCSGMVSYVLANHGVVVPRSSAAMYNAVEHIPKEEMEPGDLVFFTAYRSGPSHVGFYVGEGMFIHAPSSGGSVTLDPVDDPSYWGPRFLTAARVH